MDAHRKRAGRMVVLFMIVIMMSTALIGSAAAETSSNHAKTQVLLYLVGSDLETKSGDATADLNEIVEAYGTTDPKDLDVIVAFGGADKDGWKGMKIATIEQLKTDAKTKKYGNGDYLYSDTSADMGSGKSLTKFLTETEKTRTADRSILIISDHGNSYDGIGTDDITKNTLKMGDISGALKGSGISSPPIMFDACLMASVEVGKTVQPYTSMMLGSEEIQRGSYDYDSVIEPLAKDPDLNTRDLMEKIAEAYINRKATAGVVRTAAIIDEKKLPTVRSDLNTLGGKLSDIADTDQGLHDLKAAYNDAVRLGISDGSNPTSVDLVSLLENIKKKRPELADNVDTTISDIKDAIVYEKHNAYSPTVYGISIASPDAMTLDKYNEYGDAVKIEPRWDEFFKKMLGASQKSSSDITPAQASSTSAATEQTTTASQKPEEETTTHVQAEETTSSHAADATTTTHVQTEETTSSHAADATTPGHQSGYLISAGPDRSGHSHNGDGE